MAGTAVPFSFSDVMRQREQEHALRLDADQAQLVAALEALARCWRTVRASPGSMSGADRGAAKALSSIAFLPRCRAPRKNAPTFMISFVNCISA